MQAAIKSVKNKPSTNDRVLRRDVKLLRSLLIGFLGTDPEGTYRPTFVKEVFMSLEEKLNLKFCNKASFLRRFQK